MPVVIAIIAAMLAFLLACALHATVKAAFVEPGPAREPPDAKELEAWLGVEEKLAAFLRHATVSRFDPALEDEEAFERAEESLDTLFPLVAKRLTKRRPGGRAVLYEWPGRDQGKKPVILAAHYDVFPAGSGSDWEAPPFGGEIRDGYVWGRGAQDIKVTLVCALEAAERLLEEGFVPARTVFFAFGGDEETGGERGAAHIASYLKERGVRASFLLDEGGFVSGDAIPFADRPLALVGLSEKGYIDVALEADGSGGFASMPPRHTASGDVARAVARTERMRFPSRITYTAREFLLAVRPFVPFAYRALFGVPALASPLIRALFSRTPMMNALIRTTSAATMLEGSDSKNVLPGKARANLNVRVLPGETSGGAMRRIEGMVRGTGVRVNFAHEGIACDPLPEASTNGEGYAAIEAAVRRVYPEAGVVPFMFAASTDTKHYLAVADDIYRFAPILQSRDDIGRIHAANERLSVENARRCARFYDTLIRELR